MFAGPAPACAVRSRRILRGMSDASLYSISFSHPSRAARLMLEHKGIDYHVPTVLPPELTGAIAMEAAVET